MTSKERHQRRFNESFRREQVSKIESGELTIADVSRLYHVRWNAVKKWVDWDYEVFPPTDFFGSESSATTCSYN